MKIVIDIPEIYYNACKEWREQGVAQVAEGFIASGIPYEEKTACCIKVEDNRYKYDREQGNINAGVSFHCSNCDGLICSSDTFCKHCGRRMVSNVTSKV